MNASLDKLKASLSIHLDSGSASMDTCFADVKTSLINRHFDLEPFT